MPILNYTTRIGVDRTVAEIQRILSKVGVSSVFIDYNAGEPIALTFVIYFRGIPLNFRLPSNWQGVHKALQDENIASRYKTEEHSKMVAWRITKDWVEAQLAIVQANLATFTEVFLPYVLTDQGKTLYQMIEETNGRFLLGERSNTDVR